MKGLRLIEYALLLLKVTVYGNLTVKQGQRIVITQQVMTSVAIVLNTTYKLANSEYAVAVRVICHSWMKAGCLRRNFCLNLKKEFYIGLGYSPDYFNINIKSFSIVR